MKQDKFQWLQYPNQIIRSSETSKHLKVRKNNSCNMKVTSETSSKNKITRDSKTWGYDPIRGHKVLLNGQDLPKCT